MILDKGVRYSAGCPRILSIKHNAIPGFGQGTLNKRKTAHCRFRRVQELGAAFMRLRASGAKNPAIRRQETASANYAATASASLKIGRKSQTCGHAQTKKIRQPARGRAAALKKRAQTPKHRKNVFRAVAINRCCVNKSAAVGNQSGKFPVYAQVACALRQLGFLQGKVHASTGFAHATGQAVVAIKTATKTTARSCAAKCEHGLQSLVGK